METTRATRREQWKPRGLSIIGKTLAQVVLDLLELTERAGRDATGEAALPDDVVDDILMCSEGDLATMIMAARDAVFDREDLRRWAQENVGASRYAPELLSYVRAFLSLREPPSD